MKTVDKLLQIMKEGGSLIAGTVRRDIQEDTATALDERLENYMFLKGVAVLPDPGTQLWYLRKNKAGKYMEVCSGKFVALGRDCVVMATNVEPEKLIEECREHFCCYTAIYVYPVGDVFESKEDAKEELMRRRAEYGN